MDETIIINITEEGEVIASKYAIIMEGENNSKKFVVYIPEELANNNNYLEFKTVTGEKLSTKRLSVNYDEDLGKYFIEYPITQTLINGNGTIELQLVSTATEDVIWKSKTKAFVVNYSINAQTQIVEENFDLLVDIQEQLDFKQDKLIAGRNVNLEKTDDGVVISAVDKAGYVTIDEVESLVSEKVAPSIEKVENSLEMATNAIEVSQSALEEANYAKESSTLATSTANASMVTAETSQEFAISALENSKNANENSENALEVANEANTSANNALEQSELAYSTANSAKTKVDYFDTIITQSLTTANIAFEYSKDAKDIATATEENRIADKEELYGKIGQIEQTHEDDKNSFNEAISQAVTDSKKYIDDSVKAIMGGEVDEAYDTFKEIQNLMQADDTQTADIIKSVNKNTTDIAEVVAGDKQFDKVSVSSGDDNPTEYYANYIYVNQRNRVFYPNRIGTIALDEDLQKLKDGTDYVALATKAITDGQGNVIHETYETIATAIQQHEILTGLISSKTPNTDFNALVEALAETMPKVVRNF
jgi:hypothetical protein